jgi:hypothetical protein
MGGHGKHRFLDVGNRKVTDPIKLEMRGIRTRTKKSKASSVQPKKLAATMCFCSLVHPESASMRIAALPGRGLAFDVGIGPIVAAR